MEQLSLQIESIKDVREGIDTAQRKACTAFIEIGYILRKADDAQLYKEMGYENIFAFASHEYGWDKSQTSRFMAINKEYSVGGYSCALIEKFEGYGQTKLAEMLKLPDNLREEIEPGTKRDDIRDIKNEHREAEQDRQKEDFEHSFAPAQQGSLLGRAIKTLFGQDSYAKKIPGLWEYMLREDGGESINPEDIRQVLAPSGYGHARAGSCMIFFKKEEIVIARGDEKERHGYGEVLHAVVHLSEIVELDTPSNWYLMVYGKELPQERIKEEAKTGENNESPLGNPVSEKAEKPPRIEGKSGQKKEEKCGSATGGIQEQSADDEKLDKAAVESGENNESPLVGQPIEGQEKIDNYTEKMPITYEKPLDKKTEDEKSATMAAVGSGENNESPLGNRDLEVVPDMVNGVCQYCEGNKDFVTNDGSFTLHLTPSGLGRIEKGGDFGIIRFEHCPKCGKALEKE